MADLSPRTDDGRVEDDGSMGGVGAGRERGQLILIAAFALAVTFVVLALIVNSAIFTENLASRGSTAGVDDALYLRASVEGSVGEVVHSANVFNTSSLDDAIGDGVANVSRVVERQQAASGAYVDVNYRSSSLVVGTRVAQNESGGRPFTSDGGAADYQLVEDVTRPTRNGTRSFEMVVEKSSLDDDGADPFEVEVIGDAGNIWEMEVWRDGSSSDEIVIQTSTGTGGTDRCVTTVPTPEAAIDVTGGTVEGQPCDALRHVTDASRDDATNFRFGSGIDAPYDIWFANGDDVAGNYSLVTTSTVPDTTNLNTGGSRTSPYATDAAYSVAVDYEFDRPRMEYETTIRVARGEPP